VVVAPIRTIIKLALAVAGVASAISVTAVPLSDSDIKTYITEYIDRDDLGVGIVVGVVDTNGPRVFCYGKTKNEGTNDVTADTIFEIGSITKIFTTLMLEDMVDKGEVKLDDPIGKFLPASVKTPSRKGKQITLLDLATHTSGLPRLPPSMTSIWYMLMHHNDPYAGFREKELYAFLADYKLERDIGAEFEYSNLGMELLGHCLALKAGTNYEALMLERICQPLGMTNTFVNVPKALQSRFATGHDEDENPVKNWSAPLPGDGGIRSTANDLLKLLSAELGLTHSILSASMAKTQIPRRPTDEDTMKIGLGWGIVSKSGVIWHNGETAGFCAWMGFDPAKHYGIVVLCNCATDPDVPGATIMGLTKYRRVVKIDYNLYDKYAGKYKGTGKEHGVLTFSRKDDHLMCHQEDQQDFEIYPESATQFFNNSGHIQIVFAKGTNGIIDSFTLTGPDGKAKFIRQK
jgi:D-alanyl-D-alanine-carboxypeptidase/D-alanyl-D-alanine-endopeptidase